jgi:hypothetical protein
MRAGWLLSAAFGVVVMVACGGGGGSTFDGGPNGDDGGIGTDGGGFVCNPPCGAGEKCSSLMRCIPADQCDGDSDCPTPGTVCDLMTHKCGPGGGCGGSVIQGALVAPNMLVVLDRSCSMTQMVGNQTKWKIAVDAVNKMTMTFNGKIRFGLTLFPDTDNMNCLQGAIPIPVMPGTEMQIQTLLTKSLMAADVNYPDGPCVTNIDTAMQQAAKEPAFMDMSRKSYALLLTDGAQAGCNAGGGDNGTLMTITQMAMAGVKTFVIGFGGAVDAPALNSFAVAGGMPLMGMTKYYDAANQMQLDMALQAIASATLGCTFKLASAPPDPNQLYVFLDKILLMRDPTHVNGWDYDAMTNTITVYGQPCTDLKAGTAKVVDIVYGCPKAPPN